MPCWAPTITWMFFAPPTPDADTAFKVAAVIRLFGHAHTEVWTAAEWEKFKDLIRDLGEG